MSLTRFVKTDNPSYVRDLTSTAVINTDSESFETYKQAREEKLKIKQLSNDVQNMKDELGEIKQLLLKVLEK